MGHMKISIDGKRCKCGAKGCLEAYTSKNYLIDSYNEVSQDKVMDIDEFEQKYIQKNEFGKRNL